LRLKERRKKQKEAKKLGKKETKEDEGMEGKESPKLDREKVVVKMEEDSQVKMEEEQKARIPLEQLGEEERKRILRKKELNKLRRQESRRLRKEGKGSPKLDREKVMEEKEEKQKVRIPLEQLGEEERQRILRKKELNRIRRQESRKLKKEKRAEEVKGEGKPSEKRLKKKKAEKKKINSEEEGGGGGDDVISAPEAKKSKLTLKNEPGAQCGNEKGSDVESMDLTKSDKGNGVSNVSSKIEKKRAKMMALKERTKLKKRMAAEQKANLTSGALEASEASSTSDITSASVEGVAAEGHILNATNIDAEMEDDGPTPSLITEKHKQESTQKPKQDDDGDDEDGDDDDNSAAEDNDQVDAAEKSSDVWNGESQKVGAAKDKSISRSKAYKNRKKAEAKKRKKNTDAKKADDSERTSDDEQLSEKSEDESGETSPSKPIQSVPEETKENEFSSLVAGIEKKLQKMNENLSSDVDKTDVGDTAPSKGSGVKEDGKSEKTDPPVESSSSKSDNLKAKLNSQLDGAKFRFINESLYTMTSQEAFEMFRADEDAFGIYHRGYAQQVAKWPVNPVDVIIENLKAIEVPKSIVDFGCGEAKLAKELTAQGIHNVRSFDLVAANELVTACDMRDCQLPDESVDVVVFCLSLMGTNMIDFLREANRILKKNGVLKIAEVESRCKNLKQFLRDLQKCGFKLTSKNQEHNVFFLVDLTKTGVCQASDSFPLSLEPCFYKKR